MNVKYYIKEGALFTVLISYIFDGEEYVVWWKDKHIGSFLSDILNSDTPLYDLTLSCYNDLYIYENLRLGNLANDFIYKRINIKSIVGTEVHELYNNLLSKYNEDEIFDYMKDYANKMLQSIEMYQTRLNEIIDNDRFSTIDIPVEKIKNITDFINTILLEEIYQDYPHDTIEKRLYSYLNANNGEYSKFFNYKCEITSYALDNLRENAYDKWFDVIRVETQRDFNSLIDELRKNDNDSEFKIVTETNFSSFYEFILFVLVYMVQNKIKLKICKNCGKYFYPEKRSDAIFCDDVSPQDNTKTCKEYGGYINQQNKINSTPTLKLHKQIYNTFRNQYNRDKKEINFKRLSDFLEKSNHFKINVFYNEKTESEYLEWLKRVKESGEVE
jgi:hypothetical protein